MSTLWLKIAGIAVVALILIMVAANFMSGEKQRPVPRPQTRGQSQDKTVYDTWKEDDKRLNAPAAAQPQTPTQASEQPAAPQPAGGQPVAQAPVTPPQPTRPLKFKPLEEEQQIRAEQLWQMVMANRKMGRLPVITYGQMVKYCRQILEESPGSEYAYKAKRALADIPDYAIRQYNVTPQELDLSEFYK